MLTKPGLALALGALAATAGFAQASPHGLANPWHVARVTQKPAKAASVHQWVKGEVRSGDPAQGTVMLWHDAIKSLQMPATTMDYRLSDPAKAKSLARGERVEFQPDKDPTGSIVIKDIRKAH